jgi:chromosome segregation protein
MRLKKLEISGFKSFMDRTSFVFDPGVTAVVGPNGCGKSNIVDAIRWAMGEQSAKALRGKMMEDVIFNGSDAHKPLGMAEVRLTFENTNGHTPAHLSGCSEIEVSRRLFRSGESEYAINRVPCRRRDVWELFMDTGLGNRSFAIVEQDRIARIIHAKPEERRVVVEEVAGISKYKSRREAAQRKMEATRQNLLRIKDVRLEVGRQIRGLERQAQKAKRYRRLRHEMRDLERQMQVRLWRDLDEQRQTIEEEGRALQAREEKLLTDLQVQESAMEEDRLRTLQREKELTERQDAAHQLEKHVQTLDGEIESHLRELKGLEATGKLLAEEFESLETRIQANREQLDEVTCSRTSLEAEHVEAETAAERCRSSVERLASEHEQAQEHLEEAKADLVEWLSERATLRNSLGMHQQQLEETDRFLERRRTEEQALEQQLDDFRQNLEWIDKTIQAKSADRERLMRKQAELSKQSTELEQQKEALDRRVHESRSALHHAQSRLRSLMELQSSLEGFGAGAKAFKEHHHRGEVLEGRTLKLLADVVDIAPGLEQAVAGLLGDKLQYFVVDDRHSALQAAAFVRDRELGRAGFLPLADFAGDTGGSADDAGDWAPYLEWEEGYRGLGSRLFGDAVLIDDIRQAKDPQEGRRQTYVARSGEVWRSSGVVEAGCRQDPSTLFLKRKHEIKQLEAEECRLLQQAGGIEEQQSDVRHRSARVSAELDEIGGLLHRSEIDLAENKNEYRVTQEAVKNADQRLEVLRFEVEERIEERTQAKAAQKAATERLVETEERIRQGEERIQDLTATCEAHRAELDEQREVLTRFEVRLAAVLERCEGLNREAAHLEQRLQELLTERTHKAGQRQAGRERARLLQERIRQQRDALHEQIEQHRRARASFDAQRRELDDCRARLQHLERSHQETRRIQREVDQQVQDCLLRRQKVTLEIDHLERDLKGRLEMRQEEIAAAATALPDTETRDGQEALLSLKAALERLGDVNLMAVEQYDELKERYDFLTGQHEDLESSIQSLHSAIQKINRTSRKRFREAFGSLNQGFQKVFPVLFDGGEAKLVLTEADDVLEAGIEIVARPPGKRLQNISLLSGGEKALTAVALIFAMITIKPTPFCMFDEVDAPLDDANIDRFNQMVKDLSHDSQFILVTHNKRTMGMVDALYGITMETPGVSRLISVRLN